MNPPAPPNDMARKGCAQLASLARRILIGQKYLKKNLGAYYIFCISLRNVCGNSSVGRASASQAEGRGFESRFPLNKEKHYKSNIYDLQGNIFKDKVQHKSLKKRSVALFCT